ncbi:MAG: D-amino acid aminotransferase [Gammaproteobacteria bacterium TMED182]|nr:D-amino acid aminotransferase [Gammaproteobacteria bacterium]RPG49289.1 MAG: D-amino acid aminotransferase [Gammaproteobacteria bacterium TMED182]
MAIAYLNGAWTAPSDAKISVFDRGFMFGDGVYEVMPVYGGKIFTKTAHLERLARSLREIRLTTRFSEDEWSQLLDQAVEKAGEDNALIYLQVTRGVAPERSHVYLAAEPTVLITVTPFTPNNEQDIVSLRVCTKEDFRWHRADIKVTSLIANGMIKNEALAEGYHDAIMVRAGFVTEATSSNVFTVVDREIMTPPKSELLLHGITREEVIRIAQELDLKVKECEVQASALEGADEVWLSATGMEVQPIGEINGMQVGDGKPGPIWRQMFRAFQDEKQKAIECID